MKKKKIRIWGIVGGILLFFTACKTTTQTISTVSTAMGTMVNITIYTKDDENRAAEEIMDCIASFEEEISVKKENSMVSLLNQGKYNQPLPDAFLADLDTILEVSKTSRGALDITLGELTRLWNLDEQAGNEYPLLPSEEEVEAKKLHTGYDRIHIQDKSVLLEDGVSLDLGAVGKGMALDRVSVLLPEMKEIRGGVFSIGGSVYTYGEKNGGDTFRIGIVHPRQEGQCIGILTLPGGTFVSTSGDYERYIMVEGKRYHHILDPDTGYPADSGLCAVTIVCDNGLLSDALSTACFVLGREKGMELLENYDVEGLFIEENMKITMTEGMKELFSQP